MTNTSKVAGGLARARALSKEERSAIARKGAAARHGPKRASHEGPLRIGEAEFHAVVVDGRRLLSQRKFASALGMSDRRGAPASAVSEAAPGLPPFLSAEILKPFISQEILSRSAPVKYLTKSGTTAHGYDAELLPLYCEVFLDLRDRYTDQGKAPPKQYAHIIDRSNRLHRALAKVGIIALVDEATGYQEVRDRKALERILDLYLREEFERAWAKRFPDSFYKQIFRLRGWTNLPAGAKGPRCVAGWTEDIVYRRLAPGILDELKARNPLQENGRRRSKHHQWFTEEIGHHKLAEHIAVVTALMQASTTWSNFMRGLNKARPVRGSLEQLELGLDSNIGEPNQQDLH